MSAGTAGFHLKTLAELLQKVFASVDLAQIARTVGNHVRDAIPTDIRNPSALKTIERRMLLALEDLYLAGLHGDDHVDDLDPSLEQRISTAESYYHEQIENAARTIERASPGSTDGEILRAAAEAIAEAASEIAARRNNDFALELARDLEGLGAPPSLLFGIDGRIVWTNHAVTLLCERRELDKPRLLQAASRLSAPLCTALRCREEPKKRGQMRKRVSELGVHLTAKVRRRDDNVGESLLLLQVSEAKRATQLSPREQQVARLVARHGSYKKAAECVGISLDSVRTYVRRIYRKFSVNNRTQLKARLIREGLYDADKS